MDFTEIERLYAEGLSLGRQGVIACLVVRPDGRIFAQRRAPNRRTFPGCWDLVGGHIETGETPQDALVRELTEETGWTFQELLGLCQVVDWESPGSEGTPRRRREFVVAITVVGGWDSPRLETSKVTEGRWFGPENLEILNENRAGRDTYVYDLIRDFLNGSL